MAKITRKTAQIFGSSAGASQIAQFGSFAAGSPAFSTDPATIQSLGNWLTGWFAGVEAANSPAIEDLNAFCYVMAYQIAYALQAGVSEWDAGTTYYIGSVANDGNGNQYVSITNANLNNVLSSTANWQPMLKLVNSGFVSNVLAPTLSANQSITLPLVPATSAQLNMTSSGAIQTWGRGTIAFGGVFGTGAFANSLSSGAFNTGNTSPTDVTNLSFTLTTTGRPIFVALISDATASAHSNLASTNGSGAAGSVFQLKNTTTGTTFADYIIGLSVPSGTVTNQVPSSTLSGYDFPAAGNNTYKCQAFGTASGGTTFVTNTKMIAYEI